MKTADEWKIELDRVNADVGHFGWTKVIQEIQADAASAPSVLDCWQPIETAPVHDVLLLKTPKQTITGYYGGSNSGWHSNTDGLPSIWPLPTHWMPLPPPPKKED